MIVRVRVRAIVTATATAIVIAIVNSHSHSHSYDHATHVIGCRTSASLSPPPFSEKKNLLRKSALPLVYAAYLAKFLKHVAHPAAPILVGPRFGQLGHDKSPSCASSFHLGRQRVQSYFQLEIPAGSDQLLRMGAEDILTAEGYESHICRVGGLSTRSFDLAPEPVELRGQVGSATTMRTAKQPSSICVSRTASTS